jgi:non-ribosomal peptide synthetase component F
VLLALQCLRFRTFIESVVSDRQQTIAYLPLLSPQERHKILVERNDTQRDYPRDRCLHQLFERQVEQTPDSIAC